MLVWSAKSFVSPIARAIEDPLFPDGTEGLSVIARPQEVGGWKKKKKKKKIGIAQNMRVTQSFGGVPSIRARSILGGK